MKQASLPTKEDFYSKLTDEGTTDEDNQHAQTFRKEFNIESMKEYHNFYNLPDVLLLAEIFGNFRKIRMNQYGLDPAWHFNAPGLGWDQH